MIRNSTKKPKIAFIGQKRVPSREGGIEKTVGVLSQLLSARGWEVLLLNRKAPGEEKNGVYGPAKIRRIPTPRGSFGVAVYSFLAAVRAGREGCDVLFFHASGPSVMIPLAKLCGRKCAAMLHGIDSGRAKWGRLGKAYLRCGERFAVRHADVCFVLSENMRKTLRARYGKDTVLLFNGTDPAPEETAELAARAETALHRKNGQPGLVRDSYILAVSRLVPEKGVHDLITAFRQCRTDQKLVIAGAADPACRAYYEELRRLAEGDGRILFTGHLAEAELWPLYENAYLYVLPSYVEGMAHTLLEAMSASCACLVSDIPENTEVTEDHAMVFRRGDVQDLADKLQAVLDEKACRDRYKEGAAAFIRRKYSWDVCADRLDAELRRIL